MMVHVTAPATLPAGYTFEALLNDDPNRPFTCEVVSEFLSAVPSSLVPRQLSTHLLFEFCTTSFDNP